MGYYSDFGLRLEFKENKGERYLETLFNQFLEESDLKEEFEIWGEFDYIFQNISFSIKNDYDGKDIYLIDIISYGLKFYSTSDYDGWWVDTFIDWLKVQEICEFHYVRIGEHWEDIEEIYTDNVEFPLSMKRQIDFE